MSKPLKLLYPFWRDEFESAACLALVEAARSFDPARCIRFSTFARFRIRGALMDVGRSMALQGFEGEENPPGLVALSPFHEEHGTALLATSGPHVGAELEVIDEVEFWLRKLPRRQAEICRLYYLYGKTQAQIAQKLGCSQSEITRLHRKSIRDLAEPYFPPKGNNSSTWRARHPKRAFNLAKSPSQTKNSI